MGMAYYKTISVYKKVSDITRILQKEFGYTIINLRKILVDEYGYKNTKDILKRLNITKSVLFIPFAFRNSEGYSLLVSQVGELLEKQKSGYIGARTIDCYTVSYIGNLRYFRAEVVFETIIKRILSKYKLINYENNNYLP